MDYNHKSNIYVTHSHRKLRVIDRKCTHNSRVSYWVKTVVDSNEKLSNLSIVVKFQILKKNFPKINVFFFNKK